MSGFANQIIGGLSKLVRPAIQSPDFQAGAQGWTINKDGTAEFNDGTFRGTLIIDGSGVALLVYTGPPANGNLLVAISSAGGTDPYGNDYFPGITLPTSLTNQIAFLNFGFPGTTYGPGQISASSSLDPYVSVTGPQSGGNSSGLNLYYLKVPQKTQAQLAADYITSVATTDILLKCQDLLGDTFQVDINLADGLQIGNGPAGKYYYERVAMSAQTITANNTAQLNNFVGVTSDSDYGAEFSQWNLATGVWTCPETGPYIVCMNPGYNSVPAGFTNHFPIIKTNGVQFSEGGAATILNTLTHIIDLTKNDTLTFHDLFTGTAGATTHIDTAAPPKSMIAIRRCL